MYKKQKSLFIIFIIFFNTLLFANKYQITDVKYEITGKTKESALIRNITINKKTVFENEDALLEYIEELKQTFLNTREFEKIEIEYNIANDDISEDDDPNEYLSADEIKEITLIIKLKDSFHFLTLPYIKYSTSDGLSAKIKIYDTNFLGSMNLLTSSFNLNFKPDPDKEDNKLRVIEPEFSFEYDFPFKIGTQNFTWLNNYNISYKWGENTPEWAAETGIEWTHDLGKKDAQIDIAFLQGFYRNLDYRDYGDDIYFSEKLKVSTPITVFNLKRYGPVKFVPYANLFYHFDPIKRDGFSGFGYTKNPAWKADGIDLMGPKIYSGGLLTFENVNWNGNYRDGVSFSFGPSISYNFASIANKDVFRFSLGLEAKASAYKSFKYIGFNTRFWGFAYINDEKNSIAGSNKVDTYLRGIIDGRKVDYGKIGTLKYNQTETPIALIFNFDAPVHIFTTDWENFPVTRKIPFMKYFNFEFQLSPFFDFALIQTTKERHGYTRIFNPKDGFYAAGIEAILYPTKWKSLELRISAGFDVGTLLFGPLLETSWRNKKDEGKNWLKTAEISIGIGLHY